jgi:hypothetical protein
VGVSENKFRCTIAAVTYCERSERVTVGRTGGGKAPLQNTAYSVNIKERRPCSAWL